MKELILGTLNPSARAAIDKVADNEPIVFVITSTMKLNAKYDESVLAATDTRLILYCSGETTVYDIDSFEKMFITRMYGNSALRLKLNDGSDKHVFRFSNDSLSLCEAAAEYLNNVKKGENKQEQYEILESVYNKQHTSCPKCGRALRSADAECLNCNSKHKLIQKFAKVKMQ